MAQSHRRVVLIAVLAAAVLLLTLAAPVARARVASPWDAVEDDGLTEREYDAADTPFFISEAERSNTLKVMQAFAAAMPSLGWSGTDFCKWAGVRCFDTNVSFIATGSLAIGTLPEMPDDVDYSMVKLDQINLFDQNTGITGTLPSSWGKLHKVRTLNLGYTSISSTLPASWSSMSSLRFLTLSSTDLFGTLPAAWSSMPAIEQIVISSTQITGTLPEEWSAMRSVRRIHFQQCNLYGSFHASWARMPSLERLGLQRNNFCGCVPDSWLASPTLWVGVDAKHRMADCATAHACVETTTPEPVPSSSGSTGDASGPSGSSTATTAEPTPSSSGSTGDASGPSSSSTATTAEPTPSSSGSTGDASGPSGSSTATTAEPTPSSSGSTGDASGPSGSSTATTAEPTPSTTTTTSPTPCPTPCRVPNCMTCAPGNAMRCSVCFPGYVVTAGGRCMRRAGEDAAVFPVGTAAVAAVCATVVVMGAVLA